MRVRVNFTLDLDPEQYREAFEVEDSNEEIRRDLQDRAYSELVLYLRDEGVRARRVSRRRR